MPEPQEQKRRGNQTNAVLEVGFGVLQLVGIGQVELENVVADKDDAEGYDWLVEMEPEGRLAG